MMGRAQVVELVLKTRLVAILRLPDLRFAQEIVGSLLAGGIRAIELTMTNTDAPQVVSELLREIPEFHKNQAALGIGSVRTVQEAHLAIDSGANFLVSPICLEPMIHAAQLADVAIFPGAFTPSEIAMAREWGADIIKLFPARSLGPDFVRDVLAPMPYLKLMPTGGVSLANMQSYFDAGAVAVGLGGLLLKQNWLQDHDWSQIEQAARELVAAAQPS